MFLNIYIQIIVSTVLFCKHQNNVNQTKTTKHVYINIKETDSGILVFVKRHLVSVFNFQRKKIINKKKPIYKEAHGISNTIIYSLIMIIR